MTLIFHSDLSKDLSLILNDADDFNVIIRVGENQNTKEFRAHSVILRARSSYFKGAFSTDWITKENNMITFNKPNITPTVFEMILKYIYTGELDLTEQSGEDILGLLVASDELLLEGLFRHVQDYLVEKQASWIQQNFVLVLHIVFKLARCKKLQDYCIESICADPKLFITSKEFLSLDKDILYGLFKRDDFQIEEVVAWDCLIKWGIKQTPGLENERNKDEWTDKNYEDLKNTLSDLIPFIKFLKITSEEFYHKVLPYKAIIPNSTYEEVMKYYLVDKPRLYSHIVMPQIESNIIESKFANVIANWIDKKTAMLIRTEKDPLYKFNLMYCGSRDGISNDSFRNKCDGLVESLVLIRVQQSSKIFGGYSSIGFGDRPVYEHGYQWYYTSDNFIFSFINGEDTQNIKISRVVNYSKAMLGDNTDTSFNFGCGSLCMDNRNLYAYNYYGNYENDLNSKDILTIEEIETFAVVKQ